MFGSHRLINQFRSNEHNQKGNYNQHKKDTSLNIDINNLFIFSFFFFANHNFDYTTVLNQYATANATIPNDKLINLGNNFDFGFFIIKGTIITAPNQPADRLINKSENVSQNFESTNKSIA